MRWGYRFRQFLMRARAGDAPTAHETAQGVLSEAGYALFQEMSLGDQVHALYVLRALGAVGTMSTDLAQAALLHDVGKSKGHLTLPFRVLIVFLEWVGGGLLERLALAEPTSWRYPFYVHVHHAELGALLCEEAGCSPLMVYLVRYHERPLEDVVDDPTLSSESSESSPDVCDHRTIEALIALKEADESC